VVVRLGLGCDKFTHVHFRNVISNIYRIYTTINFTRYSVTEVAPYLRLARRGLRMVDTRYGGKWAWLAGHGSCRASRHEWQAWLGRCASTGGVIVHYEDC